MKVQEKELEKYRALGAESFFRGAPMLRERRPTTAEMGSITTYEALWADLWATVNKGQAYYACREGQPPRRLDHPTWVSNRNLPGKGAGKIGLDSINPDEHLVLLEWNYQGDSASYWVTLLE